MMKRKLLVLLIVSILAITMIVATACNDTGMIQVNNERNYRQITAKITLAGRESEVDKLDLSATIYNQISQYYQSYQQGGISEANYLSVLDSVDVDRMNESRAKGEAYTLYCIDMLYKALSAEAKAEADKYSTVGKAYDAAERTAELEHILSKEDKIAAIKSYNEQMQSLFDSYLEAYDKEQTNATAKSSTGVKSVIIKSKPGKLVYEVGESLQENGLKVVAVYEKAPETEVELSRSDYKVTGFDSKSVTADQEITVTFGGKTATFTVDIVTAKPSRPAMPKEDADEANADEEEPIRFEVDLENQIKAARAEKDKPTYTRLETARDRLKNLLDANYRDYDYYYLSKLKSQAVTACEEMIGSSAAAVTEAEIDALYNKKVEAQKQALLLGTTKYSEVSDASSVKTQIVHEDGKVFYVRNLVLGIADDLKAEYTEFEEEGDAREAELEAFLRDRINESGVYISNPEYDKDAKCEEEDCSCHACVNYTGEEPGNCTDAECTCVKCPNKRFITKEYADKNGIALSEDETVNIVDMRNAIMNDLKGKLDGGATPTEMIAAFDKWLYMVNDDDGTFERLEKGKLGYSDSEMTSDWDQNFVALSKALAYGTSEEEKNEWHIEGTGVGSFGYCYSSFGIHIVMLSGYALEDPKANDITDLGNGLYALPVTAITDYGAYDEDAEGGVPAGTIKYDLKKSLEEDKKNELVGAFQQAFYQEGFEEDATVEYYHVYQDIIDQYDV